MADGQSDWAGFRHRVDEAVLYLFALVGESMARATAALLDEEPARAQRVITEDRQVDDHCAALTDLIKERLPDTAGRPAELEELVAVLQMVPELERSGDLAEHIARRTLDGLGGAITPRSRGLIQAMNDVAVRMWRVASVGYQERSRDTGFDLAEADDELDNLAAGLVEEAMSSGVEPRVVAELALLARFYERYGDHAVNLARRTDAMVERRSAAGAQGLRQQVHSERPSAAAWRWVHSMIRRLPIVPDN